MKLARTGRMKGGIGDSASTGELDSSLALAGFTGSGAARIG
ncbi:MAG: hypothetical protein ABSA78_13050 [Candidatus Sulfotelmatobacter sp.]